jgi:hypothetical protein
MQDDVRLFAMADAANTGLYLKLRRARPDPRIPGEVREAAEHDLALLRAAYPSWGIWLVEVPGDDVQDCLWFKAERENSTLYAADERELRRCIIAVQTGVAADPTSKAFRAIIPGRLVDDVAVSKVL